MLSFVIKVKYISLTYTIEILNIWTVILHSMVFSFVCMGFFVQIDNFSLIWRRHHYRWWAAKFDLCLARMAIERWGFLSVPHLLWHGASVYHCHLRGPVSLTPIAQRFAVALSVPVFIAAGIRTPNLPQVERSNQLRHRRGWILCIQYPQRYFFSSLSYPIVR